MGGRGGVVAVKKDRAATEFHYDKIVNKYACFNIE